MNWEIQRHQGKLSIYSSPIKVSALLCLRAVTHEGILGIPVISVGRVYIKYIFNKFTGIAVDIN